LRLFPACWPKKAQGFCATFSVAGEEGLRGLRKKAIVLSS